MNEQEIKRSFPTAQYHPVLVTEVTRMSKGNYCVAGWDVHARRMVRPLQASGANWRLGADRSIFYVGNLVNCVPTGASRAGYPHATEDLPLTAVPTLLRQFDEPETFAVVIPHAFQTVNQLFGSPLVEYKYGSSAKSVGEFWLG